MDLNRIRLIGWGGPTKARQRNVDRMVDYNRSIQQHSGEVAIAAIAGTIVAGRDHAGAGGSNVGAAARRDVAVAAISSDAGDLNRRLIESHIVGLVGQGAGT